MTENPAATVPHKGPRRSVRSILLAVISIGSCLLVEGAILATQHRFSQFIADFGLNLNATVVTRCATGPFLPTLLAIVIFAAVLKEFVLVSQPLRNKCNCVIMLIGAGCFTTYLACVSVLMKSLMFALST